METLNSFQQAIKSYLDQRAKTDELFAKAYSKPQKSIHQCCDYIMGEARKQGNAVAISDAEVFGMAVHYYDEDNIKVEKLPANTTVSVSKPVELSQKDKEEARKAALKRIEEEQYNLIRKKAVKPKKTEVEQLSLF